MKHQTVGGWPTVNGKVWTPQFRAPRTDCGVW